MRRSAFCPWMHAGDFSSERPVMMRPSGKVVKCCPMSAQPLFTTWYRFIPACSAKWFEPSKLRYEGECVWCCCSVRMVRATGSRAIHCSNSSSVMSVKPWLFSMSPSSSRPPGGGERQRWAEPTSTSMLRHFPCMKRQTESAHRVMWPARIARQMSDGSSVEVRCTIQQMLSGIANCEMREM